MALIVPGTGIGQASGKLGGMVFSHNRGGAYVRARSMPTQPGGKYQTGIRDAVEAASQQWRALSANARAAWVTWADGNPLPNRIGQSIRLQGNAAYVQLNARIALNGGVQIGLPPPGDPPLPLATMSLNTDVGAGAFNVVYTPTPLTGGCELYVWGCLLQDPSITYVKNRLRQFAIGGVNGPSPFNIEDDFKARFGTPQVGNGVVILAQVYNPLTGQVSLPLRASGVVVST
jgi:hypothetical protein